MPGLSDEDMDRIARFTRVPRYKRSPGLLVPEDGSDEEVEPEVDLTD